MIHQFLSGQSLYYDAELEEIFLKRDEETISLIGKFPPPEAGCIVKLFPKADKIYIQQGGSEVMSYLFGVDSLIKNPIENFLLIDPFLTEEVECSVIVEDFVFLLLKDLSFSNSLTFLLVDVRDYGQVYEVSIEMEELDCSAAVALLEMKEDYLGVKIFDDESQELVQHYFFRFDREQLTLNNLEFELINQCIELSEQQLSLIKKESYR